MPGFLKMGSGHGMHVCICVSPKAIEKNLHENYALAIDIVDRHGPSYKAHH